MSQSDRVFSRPFSSNAPYKHQPQSELSKNRKRAYFISKQFNHYYLSKFKKISSKKYLSGWNSAACCLGFIWFFYRKMYLYGSLSLMLMILVGVVFEFLDPYALLSFATILGLSGLCANPIYKAFVDQQIRKIESTQDEFLSFEFKQQGGVNRIVAAGTTLLFLLLLGLWRFL